MGVQGCADLRILIGLRGFSLAVVVLRGEGP